MMGKMMEMKWQNLSLDCRVCNICILRKCSEGFSVLTLEYTFYVNSTFVALLLLYIKGSYISIYCKSSMLL